MVILGVESSCDETSAAVVREGGILANIVSSQTKLHAEYGGVVPELATREHLRNLLPVAHEALAQAEISIADVTAIAATQGPGLPAALMIGFQAAQACALVLGVPFFGINHHEAHLYSPWISGGRADFDSFQPNVSLIVSGGHTMLVHVRKELEHVVLGGTLDDAAGECFDKSAKLIGLAYPGGPEIDRLAHQGNSAKFEFPRPLIHDASDDFSFSGLKTSVRYHIRDHPQILESRQELADFCASVQGAIVDVLVAKTVRAAKRLGVRCITASGGVTCNSALRAAFESAAAKHKLEVRISDRSLSTDNAGMIAVLAERKLQRGTPATELTAEASPALSL
jgi:N6-L-threonylcarbamoyladenine synthase